MRHGQRVHFQSKASAHRDRRARRLLEKLFAALTIAALVYAGLFFLVHIHGAVVSLAQSQYRATDVYYPSCAAARAAGVAPIYRGQPGYRAGLDADNNGIACEPFRNWGSND
jgi:hypothetical protein